MAVHAFTVRVRKCSNDICSFNRCAIWTGSRAVCIRYIIVVTESFDEHLKWLRIVLERLVAAGLKVNENKCEFCCSSLVYLGFLLDKDGLRPDPVKVLSVLEYPHKIPLAKLSRKQQPVV